MKFLASFALTASLAVVACSDMSMDPDDTVIGTSNVDPGAQIETDLFVELEIIEIFELILYLLN